MTDVLVLHTSTIPGYEGRMKIIEPTVWSQQRHSAHSALQSLAEQAARTISNAVLGVGFYVYTDPNSRGSELSYVAYGTSVLTEGPIDRL